MARDGNTLCHKGCYERNCTTVQDEESSNRMCYHAVPRNKLVAGVFGTLLKYSVDTLYCDARI